MKKYTLSILFSALLLTSSVPMSYSQESQLAESQMPELFSNPIEIDLTTNTEIHIPYLTTRSEFVDVNMDALNSDAFSVNLFGKSVVVDKHSITRLTETDFFWHGTVGDSDYVSVTLHIINDTVYGNFQTTDSIFRLKQTIDHLYVLHDLDPSLDTRLDDPPGFNEGSSRHLYPYLIIFLILMFVLAIYVYSKSKRKHSSVN